MPSADPPRRGLGLLPFAVAVVATAVTLGGSFVFDDVLVASGTRLRAFDLERVFADNYWGDLRFDTNYRPLPLLTYALNYAVSGAPFGFHLVNVLLHGLVAWLAYRVLWLLQGDAVLAAWAASVYGALSIRSEAVAWVVGRAELLAAAAVLAGVALALRGRRGVAADGALALCAFLGCCAKEHAVLLPALVLAAGLARDGRPPWRAVTASGAGVLAYVVLRQLVLREELAAVAAGGASLVSRVDNPLHHDFVGAGVRIANALRLLGLYLAKTVAPVSLSADYSYDALPVESVPDALASGEVLLLVAFVLGGTWLFRRLREPAGRLGAVFFPLAFLVSGNLLFGIGTVFGERLAYLPSFGWALVLCGLASAVAARGPAARRAALVGLAALTAAYGARTAVRCTDWRDAVTLNTATWESTPRSVRAQLLGASAALEQALRAEEPGRRADRFAAALERAHRALEVFPGYGRAQAKVARIHLERARRAGSPDDWRAADLWYGRALASLVAERRADPDVLLRRGIARLGLARTYLAGGGAAAGAVEALRGARDDFDAYLAERSARGPVAEAEPWYYRGLATAMLLDVERVPSGPERDERLTAALADLDRALRRDPDQPDALHKRGRLRLEHGDLAGAREDFERGLAACLALGRPFHPRALSAWTFAHELARAHERAGDTAAAEQARKRARELVHRAER